MRSMPAPMRRRFVEALAECSDAVQRAVISLCHVVKNPEATPIERRHALTSIADALFADANGDGVAREVETMDAQQAKFAHRLRELMEAKRISQMELADRVGCSQPAISQMLNRKSRPQKRTILKLAEALNVNAQDLWPDLEVAELLDAVASFQQDGYVMTDEEARALSDTSRPNRPTIQAKSLPARGR
jgi:transcriptional regulator with XRE-family HTH domain